MDDIATMLHRAAAAVPDRAALIDRSGRSLTYARLDDRTTRLATALLARGLLPGDRVAVWMDDVLEHVEAYLAAAKAGLVVVPLNKASTVHEALPQLRQTSARAILASPVVGDRLDALLAEHKLDVVVGTESEIGRDGTLDGLVADGSARRLPPPAGDSPLMIAHTSGTTGTPRGAVLTHRSVRAICGINTVAYGIPCGSVSAHTGTTSFPATVTAHIMTHIYLRGTTVLMGAWAIDELLDVVKRHRATFTYMPTPRLAAFADALEAAPDRWTSLRCVLHSASKASPETLARLAGVLGGRLVEGWGMTENSGGLVTATSGGDLGAGPCEAQDVFASVGRPTIDCAVRVVGEDVHDLPHDGESVGELVISSSALMARYWDAPEETASVLKNGWYRTGDLGSIDPAGYVYVSDRRTDLIVSGGMNVYPSEVERVLCLHPAVAEAVVVGQPHPEWGQTVVAVVVPRVGATVDPADVVAHCRARLSSYKKPTAVHVVSSVPRTPSDKVRRFLVRASLDERTSLATTGSSERSLPLRFD